MRACDCVRVRQINNAIGQALLAKRLGKKRYLPCTLA